MKKFGYIIDILSKAAMLHKCKNVHIKIKNVEKRKKRDKNKKNVCKRRPNKKRLPLLSVVQLHA